MTIMYTKPSLKKAIRQPLSKRIRALYMGPRSSGDENLMYQKMYLDIKRIHLELEQLNTSIFDRVQVLVNAEKDSTHLVDNQQGSSFYGGDYYDFTDDEITFLNSGPINSALYSTVTLAAKVSNLFFKINQLERQEK